MNKLIEELKDMAYIRAMEKLGFWPCDGNRDAVHDLVDKITDKCQQDFLKRALAVAEQSHEWVMGENQKDVFITKAGIIEALKAEFNNE